MKKEIILISMLLALAVFSQKVFAYPPAVGILGKAKNCLSCHVTNGPWKDDGKSIIDILDKETKKSFRQTDESFLIEVNKGPGIVPDAKTSPELKAFSDYLNQKITVS